MSGSTLLQDKIHLYFLIAKIKILVKNLNAVLHSDFQTWKYSKFCLLISYFLAPTIIGKIIIGEFLSIHESKIYGCLENLQNSWLSKPRIVKLRISTYPGEFWKGKSAPNFSVYYPKLCSYHSFKPIKASSGGEEDFCEFSLDERIRENAKF